MLAIDTLASLYPILKPWDPFYVGSCNTIIYSLANKCQLYKSGYLLDQYNSLG